MGLSDYYNLEHTTQHSTHALTAQAWSVEESWGLAVSTAQNLGGFTDDFTAQLLHALSGERL